MTTMLDADVHFEIEWSHAGADDWFKTGTEADTIESARKKLKRIVRESGPEFEQRIVKVTITQEVVK